MFLVFAEIGLDQLFFVVHDTVELRAAVLPELPHDVLHDGQVAHWDQGLGQNFGVRLKARALAARHDDHGQPQRGERLRLDLPFQHDVRDTGVPVQHRYGNAAVPGQQTERLLPAAGGDGVTVASARGAILQRTAGEQTAPHVAVRQRGGKMPGGIGEKEDLFGSLIQAGQRCTQALRFRNTKRAGVHNAASFPILVDDK